MPFPGCVPELTDGVVRLRAHRPDDAERIVEQSTDAETMRWTTVPRPYDLDDARDFLAKIEREWGTPGGLRHWAITDAADPSAALPRHRRPAPPGRWRRGDRLRPAPARPRLGADGRCRAAGQPLVVRRGRHPGALAGRARQLRLVAGGVVVRVHPPRHHPAVAPRPRRPHRPGPRRLAGQPGRRRRHGAPHAVGGRTGARRRGGPRHPAAALARPRHRGRSSRATSPSTTCPRAACSTPTPSPSG